MCYSTILFVASVTVIHCLLLVVPYNNFVACVAVVMLQYNIVSCATVQHCTCMLFMLQCDIVCCLRCSTALAVSCVTVQHCLLLE